MILLLLLINERMFLPIQYFLYFLCVKSFLIFILALSFFERNVSVLQTVSMSDYDYIIVGSGTAGSIIASKLQSVPNITFIVLEAGGYGNFILKIPVLGPLLQGSIHDWNYKTEPNNISCLAFENNACSWPRGKIVGGTSQLNNMIYVRGNITQYVEWFDDKYSKHDIESHFHYLERFYMRISSNNYLSEFANRIIAAGRLLGYNTFDTPILNQLKGSRWSPSDNIDTRHILTNCVVNKVIFSNETADGVAVTHFGKNYIIKAKKGVILSAGVINTPKILMLSGVGPSDHLKQHKISVVKNLNVGKNLKDHVTTGMDLIILNKSLDFSSTAMFNPFNILQYFLYGTGPLTSSGCEAIGFVSSDNATFDLQFMVLPVGLNSDLGVHLKKAVGLSDFIWEKYYKKILHKQTVTILPIILQPASKGEVLLRSNNPFEQPLIKPNYFADKRDIDLLIKGIKIIAKLLQTAPLLSLGASFNVVKFPGCESHSLFSDPYWECYIKHMTLTSFHPVGTCSLHSVVDLDFKIKGLKNLFVVDASVLPEQPLGNINAAIALLASLFFENLFFKDETKYCGSNELVLEYFTKKCYRV